MFIFFPREDDTKDLKILINHHVFSYDGKRENLRTATSFRKTTETEGRSYDYDYTWDRFTFDSHNIYVDGEPVSLSQLLVGKIIFEKHMDDTIREIIEKRNLKLERVLTGRTKGVYHDGVSIDSVDIDMPAYEILLGD